MTRTTALILVFVLAAGFLAAGCQSQQMDADGHDQHDDEAAGRCPKCGGELDDEGYCARCGIYVSDYEKAKQPG